MPIYATSSIVSSYVPTQYYFPIALGLVALAVLRTYAQGRRTNRERDLHDRTVLVTGAFSPLGLHVVQALAERGARVIALTDAPGPAASLVSIVRQRTQNDEVFAEECDLASHASVLEFARQMLARLADDDGPQRQRARLDAVVFAHEYAYGARDGGRAAFLLTTLLLPGLLVAPAHRDIRLLFVVNPFYAAAATHEGARARRSIVVARHLQRVLNALPTAPPVPEPSSSSNPSDAPKKTSSNIAAVAVSPGISRTDTVAPFLRATHAPGRAFSNWGFLLYLLLQPVLRILAKTPAAAIQSILHALFLPRAGLADAEGEGEVLMPGALYADCAVVPFQPDDDVHDEAKGVAVWEELEQALKAWAKEDEAVAAATAASDDGRASVRKRKNKDAKVRWADETETEPAASTTANGDPKPNDE